MNTIDAITNRAPSKAPYTVAECHWLAARCAERAEAYADRAVVGALDSGVATALCAAELAGESAAAVLARGEWVDLVLAWCQAQVAAWAVGGLANREAEYRAQDADRYLVESGADLPAVSYGRVRGGGR